MAKRNKRYASLGIKSKMDPEETCMQLRNKFPKALVSAYIKVIKSKFKDEELYDKFVLLRQEYLGVKAKDRIECGKLIVYLARATADLIERKKKVNN